MKNFISLLFPIFFFCSYAQEQKKDTLFIKYDSSLLTKHTNPIEKYNYYLIKGTENQSDLTFLKEKIIHINLKSKKVLCLKDILKNSNSYYENNKVKNERLANYLGRYLVFLKKEKEYIQVLVIQEIE